MRYVSADAISNKSGVKNEKTEIIQDLPAGLLPIVLRIVALDDAEASRANLEPSMMAVASPRVFWAVVRHGNIGPVGAGKRGERSETSSMRGSRVSY